MFGPDFMDDIECGNFFDDLLDFPDDNNLNGGLTGGNPDSYPGVWPELSEAFPSSEPVFAGNHSDDGSDLSAALAVPYEDIVHMEWVSNFCSDTFSEASMEFKKENSSVTKNSRNQFHISSPVSVLESSSSCSGGSGGKTMPVRPQTPANGRHVRARSKRPRPTSFNPRPAMQIISPTSSFTDTPPPFLCPNNNIDPKLENNFAESSPLIKKKRKIKISLPLAPSPQVENDENVISQEVRKCMHCEITKTPQWRAGPMGPKTLCNACGVRYKSGRLFPEYRPAASPTFVPSIHSNSHKKVVEMRSKVVELIPYNKAFLD